MPEIDGSNGTFEYTLTNNDANTADNINIKYKPTKNARGCKDIRLIQVQKSEGYNAAGKKVTEKDEKIDTPKDSYKHMRDDRTCTNHMVDHVACEGDPFYNGNDDQDTSSKGDATIPTPSELDDDPSCPIPGGVQPGIARVIYKFETCAVCLDTGQILDCMKWQSEYTPAKNGKITVPPQRKAGSGSLNFRCALRKFVKNHTKVDPKEKHGPLRWYCPESSGSVKGPDGNFNDPFGIPVPKKFAKRWIFFIFRLFIKLGGIMSSAFVGTRIILNPEEVGGGRLLPSLKEALLIGLNSPNSTAIKFTWSGKQKKTKKGLILSPFQNLSASNIAPFVNNESRFQNDFRSLEAREVSDEQLRNLLDLVKIFFSESEINDSRDDNINFPVTLTLILNLGSEQQAGFTTFLPRPLITKYTTEAAKQDSTDENLLRSLSYLALNFGDL